MKGPHLAQTSGLLFLIHQHPLLMLMTPCHEPRGLQHLLINFPSLHPRTQTLFPGKISDSPALLPILCPVHTRDIRSRLDECFVEHFHSVHTGTSDCLSWVFSSALWPYLPGGTQISRVVQILPIFIFWINHITWLKEINVKIYKLLNFGLNFVYLLKNPASAVSCGSNNLNKFIQTHRDVTGASLEVFKSLCS